MDRYPGDQFPYAAFFWPALAAASAGEIASSFAAHFLGSSGDADGDRAAQEPEGATPCKIALELHSVRLRDFTTVKSGVPTLLCTPLALHGATLADLAAGHSLVAALRDAGIGRLFMTDWRSASADMRFLGIDEYLADLNVLVDVVLIRRRQSNLRRCCIGRPFRKCRRVPHALERIGDGWLVAWRRRRIVARQLQRRASRAGAVSLCRSIRNRRPVPKLVSTMEAGMSHWRKPNPPASQFNASLIRWSVAISAVL